LHGWVTFRLSSSTIQEELELPSDIMDIDADENDELLVNFA